MGENGGYSNDDTCRQDPLCPRRDWLPPDDWDSITALWILGAPVCECAMLATMRQWAAEMGCRVMTYEEWSARDRDDTRH